MNAIINLAAKLLGLNSFLAKINGSKAYIGAAGTMITGAITALTGLAGIVADLIPLETAAQYFAFAKGLGHNANAGLIAAGGGLLSKGWTDIGQRHAVAKLEAKIAVPPPAP